MVVNGYNYRDNPLIVVRGPHLVCRLFFSQLIKNGMSKQKLQGKSFLYLEFIDDIPPDIVRKLVLRCFIKLDYSCFEGSNPYLLR